MSKRAGTRGSQAGSNSALKSKLINIPDECLVCQSDITNNSVLFHCDCIVVICQECALLQVAAQRTTYLEGLLCPYCRRPSHNIQNIEKAKAEENTLIEEAFNNLKLRPSRSNEAIKRAINAMIALGLKSSLSLEELNSDAINSPEYLPAIKLELARLQLERVNKASNSSKSRPNDFLPLPLGPLKHLSFTRNHILERALVVSRVGIVLQGTSGSSGSATADGQIVIPRTNKVACKDVGCQTIESSFDEVKMSSIENESSSMPPHLRNATANLKGSYKKSQQNFLQSQAMQQQILQQQAYYSQLARMQAPRMFGGSGRGRGGANSPSAGNYYQAVQGAMSEAAAMSRFGPSSAARAYSSGPPSYASNFAYAAGRPPVRGPTQAPSSQGRPGDHPSYYIGSSKIFCVCQKPATADYYIRCCIGVGKCNGWVHPSCCMDLAFKTPHELAYIESRGYSCFLCNHMVSIANNTNSLKRPRPEEMMLMQQQGAQYLKREGPYQSYMSSSANGSSQGGAQATSAHAQFKAQMSGVSSSTSNMATATTTEGTVDALSAEYAMRTGHRDGAMDTLQQAVSGGGVASNSKHDNDILQWMIAMVQTLPILVNRTIPGKDMNSRDLLVVFRKAHGMNLQGSLHSAKAVELLRRLVTLEHRIFELDRQAAALMKKACVEYAALEEEEAAATLSLEQQIVRREHRQYEHCVECEQLIKSYLALGILHNALEVCMNMYSWSYKVMTYLVTPEGRYRVNVPREQVQGALREAADLEALSSQLVKDSLNALAEAPLEAAAAAQTTATDDTPVAASESEQNTKTDTDDNHNGQNQPASATESSIQPSTDNANEVDNKTASADSAATLKPLVAELDATERAMLDHFEIFCFMLIEFWRQKLILCLKKNSSGATAAAPQVAAETRATTTEASGDANDADNN